MHIRRKDLTVSFSPSASGPIAPVLADGKLSEMNGCVLYIICAFDRFVPKLSASVVLKVLVVAVVVSDIKNE